MWVGPTSNPFWCAHSLHLLSCLSHIRMSSPSLTHQCALPHKLVPNSLPCQGGYSTLSLMYEPFVARPSYALLVSAMHHHVCLDLVATRTPHAMSNPSWLQQWTTALCPWLVISMHKGCTPMPCINHPSNLVMLFATPSWHAQGLPSCSTCHGIVPMASWAASMHKVERPHASANEGMAIWCLVPLRSQVAPTRHGAHVCMLACHSCAMAMPRCHLGAVLNILRGINPTWGRIMDLFSKLINKSP